MHAAPQDFSGLMKLQRGKVAASIRHEYLYKYAIYEPY